MYCDKMKQSAQGLWKIVKTASGGTNSEKWTTLTSENSADFLPNVIADALKSKYSGEVHIEHPSLDDDNWTISFEEAEVYQHLRKLNRRKAVGLDNVPTKIYSEMADCLAWPLKIIFDNSIKTRTFPFAWKTAIICPIPKTSPPMPEKVRPISLLPVISKVFEKMVLKKCGVE